MIIAIDPGKATGYATFHDSGEPIDMDSCKDSEIIEVLKFQNPSRVIIEGWLTMPDKAKAFKFSPMGTVEVIGKVVAWCEINNVPCIKQPSSIKPTAYRWAGKKPLPKSNPLNHQLDAYVHGVYYFVKNKIKEIW